MKTNKLSIILLLGIILLTSCEKEIEFKGEQTDSKLVINSLVEAGQPVKAYISKSYFFLDNDENAQCPDDVVTSLYVNGNLIGEMSPFFDTLWNYYEDNYRLIAAFGSSYCPQEGDIVQIMATANGFDEVEGTTSPLPKTMDCQMEVEVTDWTKWFQHEYDYETQEYEEDSILNVTGHLNLTFVITDPNPDKTDYFRLTTNKNNGISDDQNRYYISFNYDDPIFGASGMTENDFFDASDLDTRSEGVFTDILFDGSSYQLKVKVYFECEIDEFFDPDFFRVPFVVEHLSKEYYNYLNTCDQGDLSLQIWAEPVQTYSNVTNGFGIVGGRAVKTLWLPLPIEEP